MLLSQAKKTPERLENTMMRCLRQTGLSMEILLSLVQSQRSGEFIRKKRMHSVGALKMRAATKTRITTESNPIVQTQNEISLLMKSY